jgi:hypothetical protein
MACHALEDDILSDTLFGAFGVSHRIAGPAVQKSVIAACGPGREVEAFHKQNRQSPQRAVTGSAGSSGSASDYNYIVVFIKFFHSSALK